MFVVGWHRKIAVLNRVARVSLMSKDLKGIWRKSVPAEGTDSAKEPQQTE